MYYKGRQMTRRIGFLFLRVFHSLLSRDGEDQRLRGLSRQLRGVRAATARLELRQIRLQVRRLPQMSQSFLQNRGSHRIARRNETIVHPPPLSPRRDDARAAEIRQVTRDFWLA